MPKTTKVSGSSAPSEVAATYKGSVNPHDQKRLIALQMARQGVWVLADIARALSKGRATIGRWLKSYRGVGMEGMLKRGHGGRKPQLRQDDIEALEEVLREGKYKPALANAGDS
jgi:transposase